MKLPTSARLGADVKEVAIGMGYDTRIGNNSLTQELVTVVPASKGCQGVGVHGS